MTDCVWILQLSLCFDCRFCSWYPSSLCNDLAVLNIAACLELTLNKISSSVIQFEHITALNLGLGGLCRYELWIKKSYFPSSVIAPNCNTWANTVDGILLQPQTFSLHVAIQVHCRIELHRKQIVHLCSIEWIWNVSEFETKGKTNLSEHLQNFLTIVRNYSQL